MYVHAGTLFTDTHRSIDNGDIGNRKLSKLELFFLIKYGVKTEKKDRSSIYLVASSKDCHELAKELKTENIKPVTF